MNQATQRTKPVKDSEEFARHGGASSSRWSFGRRSMRSLATLLKRDGGGGGVGDVGGGKQKQHQLASLDNDATLGNNCIGDLMKRRKKSAEKQQQQQLLAAPVTCSADAMPNAGGRPPEAMVPRIRTTVLGCPRKLRASARSPQPPLSQLANEQQQQQQQQQQQPPQYPTFSTSSASPLYQVKCRQNRIRLGNQIPDYNKEEYYVNDDEQLLKAGADPDSDSPVVSLLLELNGEMRRIALVGCGQRLQSLSDILSLFASQWPAEVQAMAGNWRVSVLKPGSPVAGIGWEILCSDAHLASCGLPHGSRLRLERSLRCGCTCPSSSPGSSCSGGMGGRDSRLRIDQLEARVTLLSRRLTVQQDQQPVGEAEAGRLEADADFASGPIQGHQQRAQRLRDLRNACRELRQTQDALRREHDDRVRATRRMMSDLAGDVRRILGAALADSRASKEEEEEEEVDAASAAASSERRLIRAELQAYQTERAQVSAMIQDVDETTGELRHDVLHRRCRSNPAEVELLALHLSRATHRLACLKNRFPGVQTRTRDLLRREALTAQDDERLLADEEARLDAWLRKVKKLTMMLYTFKQLADAQAKEAPSLICAAAVQQCTAEETTAEARRDVLRGVLSVYPDHERRARAIERAEVGIERRRRMLREAAALKAEKTLTAAASRLKPVPIRQASLVDQQQQQQHDAMVVKVRVGEFGADSNYK